MMKILGFPSFSWASVKEESLGEKQVMEVGEECVVGRT